MFRVAKKPIILPNGVEANILPHSVTIKGTKGSLTVKLHTAISVEQESNTIKVILSESAAEETFPMAGTVRALIQNMVTGVTQGFERKLALFGVGYRAQIQGNVLTLSLGFSNPKRYTVPAGITVETPSQTDILIKGADKQLVGKVAAEIRAYRPPEPYKGKGIRYMPSLGYKGETIVLKEGKKK